MDTLRIVVAWVALVVVTLLGVALFWAIFTKQIKLEDLLGDKDGYASMGRFQLLIFTFVIALSFLYLMALPETSGFPEVPGSVLTLIGISGSSFLVSKSIDKAA